MLGRKVVSFLAVSSVVLFSLHVGPVPGFSQGATSVQLQPVLTGLSSPVFVTHAHDGSNRLFFVEQTGLIKVLQPGATAATVFLDVTGKRLLGDERGLLGLAFHPQFASNRQFFINYTRVGDGATVVARYLASTANPNVALTSEEILLVVAQPFANHNGGMIEFGPDGFLYIGMGDGGSANDPGSRAQNINELLGKILRIDVDHTDGAVAYSSPSSNPFFGPTAGRDEIYAVGMRNPWRFSFDRLTGQLYAGDVGQGQREEVDIITRGGNYGWRVFEGTRCTGLDPNLCTSGNYIGPIIEYAHSGNRCSITGGYVYRGLRSTLPYGSYLYADYCTGEIFISDRGTQSLLVDTTFSIASFGEDEAGEPYVCALGGGVYRITNPSVKPALSVSAASFQGSTLAPGTIAAAFGSDLATQTLAAGLPLPTNLAGTQVKVRDGSGTEFLAPIFFVSPGQVNYVLPEGIPAGQAEVSITSGAGVASSGVVQITPVAPGVFSANSNGSGVAAGYVTRVRAGVVTGIEPLMQYDAVKAQYTSMTIDLGPADEEVFLTLFGTGIRHRSSLAGVIIRVGGEEQQVTYADAQGTYLGLDQINVRLARSLAGRGELEVTMTVDGQAANVVGIKT